MKDVVYKAICLLAKPFLKHKWGFEVDKSGVEGVETPFVLLCSHATRLDFMFISCALYPTKLNYLGQSHNFAIKSTRWLVAKMGTIPKVKRTGDILAVKRLKENVALGHSIAIFPAGMSTHDGKSYPIPKNTAKLVKFLGAPVVTARIDGGYWALPPFMNAAVKGHVKVTLNKLCDAEELKTISQAELNEKIVSALSFDDIAYQNVIKTELPKKRIGKLDHIIYKCAKCGADYTMVADKKTNELVCSECANRIFFEKDGALTAADKSSVTFGDISSYCDYEMADVKNRKNEGAFSVTMDVERKRIDLATAKSYPLMSGKLTVNANGVRFINAEEDILYLSGDELTNLTQFNLKELFLTQDGDEIVFTPTTDSKKLISVLWFCKF